MKPNHVKVVQQRVTIIVQGSSAAADLLETCEANIMKLHPHILLS